MVRVFSLLCLLLLTGTAWAAIDAYPFEREDQKARYESLIAELRCPQCLNTNLAGSDAMIAQDLRREVYRMLTEGYSDDEILAFMHARYGDFILYEPRLSTGTLLLWIGPFGFLLVAGLIWLRLTRRKADTAALTGEEQERLSRLLQDSQQ